MGAWVEEGIFNAQSAAQGWGGGRESDPPPTPPHHHPTQGARDRRGGLKRVRCVLVSSSSGSAYGYRSRLVCKQGSQVGTRSVNTKYTPQTHPRGHHPFLKRVPPRYGPTLLEPQLRRGDPETFFYPRATSFLLSCLFLSASREGH